MVQFPSSINHEELVAPATPAFSSNPSISSNVSPMSPSESFYAMEMDHANDLAMDHINDLADEAVRPAKRGLFSCLAELNARIASRGRDAFVAEIIAKKRDDYIYIPYWQTCRGHGARGERWALGASGARRLASSRWGSSSRLSLSRSCSVRGRMERQNLKSDDLT